MYNGLELAVSASETFQALVGTFTSSILELPDISLTHQNLHPVSGTCEQKAVMLQCCGAVGQAGVSSMLHPVRQRLLYHNSTASVTGRSEGAAF